MTVRRVHDVAIVGAGLVGLALAAALGRRGLAIALVDRHPLAASVHVERELAPQGEKNHAQDWDARVYAISPSSAEFLSSLGVWQRLPAERMTPIEAMHVRGDDDGELEFSAYELGERALAWIVENRELQAALIEVVRTTTGIDVIAPYSTASLAGPVANAMTLSADATDANGIDTVSTRLVVGADGVHSWVRAQAGMREQPTSYAQIAVVANFETASAHRGRAFQWFLSDGGVLAWLPLPGDRISIVWSAPEPLARELLDLDGAALSTRVAEAGNFALGNLSMITSPAAFPLSSLRLATLVGDRIALVGDAAHGVHPLAGQGVNLGFGDVEALAEIIARRGPIDDVGSALLLERYDAKRKEPVLAMHAVTDGLARLFGAPSPWVRLLRNRGMRAVGAITPLKRMLAQRALR